KRSFSFEFMPPRTEVGEQKLWDAIRRLEPLDRVLVMRTETSNPNLEDSG
ncbi:methylenetetrahydrofolate reductase, partial [Kitasatospora sp. NPDC091257]